MDRVSSHLVIEHAQWKKLIWYWRDVAGIKDIVENLWYIGICYFIFAILSIILSPHFMDATIPTIIILFWEYLPYVRERFILDDEGIDLEFHGILNNRFRKLIAKEASDRITITAWRDIKGWRTYKGRPFPFLVIETTKGTDFYFLRGKTSWFLFPRGSFKDSVEKIETIEKMLRERCWYLQ